MVFNAHLSCECRQVIPTYHFYIPCGLVILSRDHQTGVTIQNTLLVLSDKWSINTLIRGNVSALRLYMCRHPSGCLQAIRQTHPPATHTHKVTPEEVSLHCSSSGGWSPPSWGSTGRCSGSGPWCSPTGRQRTCSPPWAHTRPRCGAPPCPSWSLWPASLSC